MPQHFDDCAPTYFCYITFTSIVNLYTVSKLYGHKDVQTTQIYAKLVDKKKDDAIDKLPGLDKLFLSIQKRIPFIAKVNYLNKRGRPQVTYLFI